MVTGTHFWRRLGLALLIAASAHTMAAQATFRLWSEVTSNGDEWTIVPHVQAPAGTDLRYEITAVKEGRSGRSNTRQSGRVTVGSDGTRALASLRLGVGPADRCDVEVKVYRGDEVVGEETLRLPR